MKTCFSSLSPCVSMDLAFSFFLRLQQTNNHCHCHCQMLSVAAGWWRDGSLTHWLVDWLAFIPFIHCQCRETKCWSCFSIQMQFSTTKTKKPKIKYGYVANQLQTTPSGDNIGLAKWENEGGGGRQVNHDQCRVQSCFDFTQRLDLPHNTKTTTTTLIKTQLLQQFENVGNWIVATTRSDPITAKVTTS